MSAGAVTVERSFPSGGLNVTALVRDRNPLGNPWGGPFYETMHFEGYTRREAVALFRESLTRRGLFIVAD
jgi:hypothetical protein